MRRFARIAGWTLVVALVAVGSVGKDVPVPTGTVVLTITGTVALTNGEAGFSFDLAMLQALPKVAYKVTDPWLGDQVYAGVELKTLLEYVGIPAGATRAVIIASDLKEFPVLIRDANYYPILIAYASDDQPIKKSKGGPLKLVYPYGIYSEIEDLYAPEQWSWFVVAIRVEY